MNRVYLLLIMISVGCSNLEQSEKEKIRKSNEKRERIYRYHDDIFYRHAEPVAQERDKYPWEENYVGSILKITKEYFRCKGSGLNPKILVGEKSYRDCDGIDDHGLPFVGGKEFVYPILIDILNYVQQKTQHKVIITCGYRCPVHNIYSQTLLLDP